MGGARPNLVSGDLGLRPAQVAADEKMIKENDLAADEKMIKENDLTADESMIWLRTTR